MSGWSGDHCRMASDLIDKEESTCRSGDRCRNSISTQLDEERLISMSAPSLGRVSIRRENKSVSVVKLERNDNKNVRQSRDKYIEKSERTYFQYVPTIQIR